MNETTVPPGFQEMIGFGLIDALLGRRSRRFFMGAHLPDGPLAYRSDHPTTPLSELERLLVVTACGGDTSWHHMIYRAASYAPHLSNYCGSALGRTYPSAAGFFATRTFFTDDDGVYVLEPPETVSTPSRRDDGSLDLETALETARQRIRKLQSGRLPVPPEVPYVEPHNTWVVNHPGTLLVSPVADLAQHVLLGLCYMLQNGVVVFDDINGRAIPGLDSFRDLVDVDQVWPLTFLEQLSLAEVSAELTTSVYAGHLLLQAMGLGGWIFNGIDPFVLLGASGEDDVPGLAFRFDSDDRWPYPNPTGLEGVMEGHCPPHFPTMRDAVDAVCERKFGPRGPYHPETPGPWKDTTRVRGAAIPHDARFRECVALQGQYIFDTFGKFPGTVPSIFTLMHLQAHHLDLGFYDTHFEPGAYLRTHATHMHQWHGNDAP